MPTPDENLSAIEWAADQRAVPRLLAIACAVAESGLDERAERWGDRTSDATAAIARRDHAALEGVLRDLQERRLRADISFGLGQQSWLFAPESDGTYAVANLLRLRDVYFDAGHAATRMCALLAEHYHRTEPDAAFRALCRYNRPAGNGQPANGDVARIYRGGIERAEALVAGRAGREAGGSVMRYMFPVAGYQGEVTLHHGSHPGASDLMAPAGTPVVAVCDGRVDAAAYGSVGGNYVLMTGDDGLEYYYAHGDRAPAVAAGARVTAGTYLFGVGTTGNASGTPPHLHIGIGRTILSGTGPAGGAGADYDAVALLRRILARTDVDGGRPAATSSGRLRVAKTNGSGLNLRQQPGTSAAVVKLLAEGTVVEAQDRAWRRVLDLADGAGGWVAEEFLEPA